MSKTKTKSKPKVKEQTLCAKCNSPRRSKYSSEQRQDFRGAGLPYLEIVYRWCECLNCGQVRVERQYVRE